MHRSTLLLTCGIIVLVVLAACGAPPTPVPPAVPSPTAAAAAITPLPPTLAPTAVPPTPVPPTVRPSATTAPTSAPTSTTAPATPSAPAPTTAPAAKRDLGKETLAKNDGWASQGNGTLGGSAAPADHIYTVHNRKELIAALNDGAYPPATAAPSDKPKIIYVDGTIDANVDDSGKALTCDDYARDKYTLKDYMAAFDPAVWGKKVVSGTLETARVTSQKAQEERVRIKIGGNTTIVGLNEKATLRGAWFDVRGTAAAPISNVIIRNLNFQDTYDCFPQWDPTDGSDGNWNSQYDMISLRYVDHAWVDHNSFMDKDTADSTAPTYFGRHFEMHDGELDITNAADLVTVSWNKFQNHDKTMLIGSSDSGATATGDKGKLRVTIHHNLFDHLGQRTPRVRFGQVHVYDNYFLITNNPKYGYTFGVGVESAIYAENNAFTTDASVAPGKIIGYYKGTAIYVAGTRLNDKDVDLLAAYNAANETKLTADVGWKPALVLKVDPADQVAQAVESGAGPIKW